MKTKYKVLTYTICEGWVDCWQDDDKPWRFDSIQEADDEIHQFLKDVKRDGLEGYERGDYMIVPEDMDETQIKEEPYG